MAIAGAPRALGRCLVWDEIASGGMASVCFGRLVGERGFSRLVAVKRVRHDLLGRAHVVRELEAEARLAGRIQHPNVVPVFDLVSDGVELGLVMEYVHGVSLAELFELARVEAEHHPLAAGPWPTIVHDALLGLHAAHEVRDESGRTIGLVHRDVSPSNILVGADGIARITDFGIARGARSTGERTATGFVKGKPWYMSPEQRRGLPLGRTADVFAAGLVLAEGLTGLEPGGDAVEWQARVVASVVDPGLRAVVATATAPDPRRRYGTAAEMAAALTELRRPQSEVARYVDRVAGDVLAVRAERARIVETAEIRASDLAPAPAPDATDRPSAPEAALAGLTTPLGGTARAQEGPRRWVVLAAAAAALLAWRARDRAPAPPPSRSPPPIVAAPPATYADPLPLPPPATAEPPPPSVPPPEPGPPEPTAKARATRATPSSRPRVPPSPSATTAARADCDPPYRVDATGKRRYRVECLDAP